MGKADDMSAPKTNAQRQAALKARRKAAGLVPVTVWVHRDWVSVIKKVEKNSKNPNKEDLSYLLYQEADSIASPLETSHIERIGS